MYEILTLKNGVKIAFEHLPFLRSVAFGIWVKNGSRYESKSVSGISHFIEHLLFKGTKKRTAKEIANEIDSIGGQINAFTAKEYTCYYTKTLDSHINVAVDVLADMFFNSNFDENEIKKESGVILEEISMYEDSPEDLCYEILHKGVFEGTSLGRPILGTRETITSFNHNTFIEYFKNQYTPDNTIISVAGNFDKEKTLDLIEKYFSDFSNNKDFKQPEIVSKYTSMFDSREKDVEQVHLNMAFEGVSVGKDELYDLSVVNTLLGGGMSSILFQKVREQRGLAYSVYSQSSSYKDIGLFTIYAGLNRENTNEVCEIVLEEIKKLKNNSIDKNLLDKTKEQLKSGYILGLESSNGRMNALGRGLTLTGRILTPDEVIDKIDNVTLESLNKVISTVFDEKKLSISAVGNVGNLDIEKYLVR